MGLNSFVEKSHRNSCFVSILKTKKIKIYQFEIF